MIKIENTVTPSPEQWHITIMGARNAMNSWDKSDTKIFEDYDVNLLKYSCLVDIGPNDHELMMKLRNAGADHRKFMRMLPVHVNITAPLYWWKEFDTYKVGTVANSCSTMHKIHAKRFELSNFSTDQLLPEVREALGSTVIEALNQCRDLYLGCSGFKHIYGAHDKKTYWWQMIQLLPTSYNQKRTVMLNYEVLANIYKSRKNHKLDEWRELCKWIEGLPYSKLITGASLKDIPICNEIMDEAKRRVEEKSDD